MQEYKFSAIVIGSGVSGLYTALKISQKINNDSKVLIITKSKITESNSYYAQGGMVAVLNDNPNDSVSFHVLDTLKAGAGLSEPNIVEFISKNSDEVVRDLLNFGVDFDKNIEGKFTLTKEAAHSVNRILHAGGDATGREMEMALSKSVINNPKIIILENTLAIELITHNNICYGVKILKNNKLETVYAPSTVIATGGIGQIYKYTTNPIGATGDGIALCYRAGAILRDMEFVQFHPTSLAIDDPIHHNRFLISEAVRGEGAKLCDENRNQFMGKYDAREELAPRDIVARANYSQMKELNTQNVYLDASVIGREKLLKRFPTIAKKCLENNIDITKDLIPVAPASHYFMGGVKTNLNGETSIKNLYAVGEASSTGLHGANRLASNSLLECVVCANIIAKNINISKKTEIPVINIENYEIKHSNSDIRPLIAKLKNIMWDNVGIYRTQKSLEYALNEIENIEKSFNKNNTKEDFEFANMLLIAKLITISALNRKESRGAHFRTDYPQTNNIALHSEIRKGEINFVK